MSQMQEQGDHVLRDTLSVRSRSRGHMNAEPRGRVKFDLVEAHAGSGDQAQLR